MDFRMVQNGLDVMGTVFQWFTLTFFLYYLFVSIFGWVRRREQPAENFPVKNRFAIIISAHNEEKVIGSALRSLKCINYPEDMYDIFVIADNCDDDTANVSRNLGAKVYERNEELLRGKGHALEWMFMKLFNMTKKYDAVCVLDADNLVSANFFMEMNKQLILGHKVVQGYLDSKNPNDSWIAGNNSIAFWISNRLFQLPRYYLGWTCVLGGTGFIVSTDVLKQIGWGATCLTEDLDFSMKLVLAGMRVSWCHDAIVYDEKPLTMAQSWKQRKRWMQGHSDCVRRYVKKLFTMAIKERCYTAFDAALYLLQPLVLVGNGFVGLYKLIILISFNIHYVLSLTFLTSALLLFLPIYANIIFVIAEGKVSKKVLLFFITVPIYSLTWVPIIIAGFLDRNKTDWYHTLHTRAIDIHEVEELSVERVG